MNLVRMAFVIALSFLSAAAQANDVRKVTLAWREVPDAKKYQLEIATNAEMDPLAESKEFVATSGQLQLKPGTYYFRVRGIDADSSPGPWSEVEGFVVNPAAPVLVNPPESHAVSEPLGDKSIRFEWKSGIKGSKYLFEVRDKKGVLLKRSVSGTDYEWKPDRPGKYAWRVGFETPTGDEWSKYRTIVFAESAYPKPEPPKVITGDQEIMIVTEEVVREGKSAAPTPSGVKFVDINAHYFAQESQKPRSSEWSLLGRIGQAVSAYSGIDKDTGAQTTGSGVVGFINAELRWRGGRAVGQKWTWSAAMNFEMIRQNILNHLFQLPRVFARVFYGKESGQTRIGPFLQLGYGQSGLFIVDTSTSSRNATITRQSIGVGGVIVHRTSPTFAVSGLMVLRRDMGGMASIIPNPLMSTMSYEAGFGLSLALSGSLVLEGRLRALRESYVWQPAGTYTDNSYLKNTFMIMDAGLGFRF